MKKKLMMLAMVSVFVCSASACGNKEVEGTESTEVQTSAKEAESAAEEKVSDREDYVAIQDLNTDEFVTLNDYKNMTIEVQKTEITDDSIKAYIEQQIFTSYPVTDRAAENGDTVNIDFEGKKDGVAFEGGTSTDYNLTLGSGTFIPGFEEGLVGVTPGETVDLDLTFPEEYQKADLAGQAVVFTVKVNSIQESAKYDTVTPEQLELMGLSDKTLTDMWDEAKAALEEEAQAAYEAQIANAILTQLMEECNVTSVPDYLVEEEIEAYNSYMEETCSVYYGCDLETFVTQYYGLTMDEYNAQLQEMSEETIKQYLILEQIARQEGLTVSEDEVMEKATQEAATYGYESADELLKATGKSLYRMYMIQERVLEKLKETTTIQ